MNPELRHLIDDIPYRLFFRLHPDRLQVIDLINRKDFHHRLKTLK